MPYILKLLELLCQNEQFVNTGAEQKPLYYFRNI